MSSYVGSFIIIKDGGRVWSLKVEPSDTGMLYTLIAIDDKERKPIIANRCEINFDEPKVFCNDGLCMTFYAEGEEVCEINAVSSIVRR